MQIEENVKLDFSDVLIRPKRSVLTSRGEVDLHRSFTFRNSKQSYFGIPILAANMDSVGTFNMANALAKHDLAVALHKHYSQEELIEFFNIATNKIAHWFSMGIMDADLEKFNAVLASVDIRNVCIDVANGYQETVVEFVKKFREANPTITIMAGNVVTGEMTEALILAGADIVKAGIGPGCFLAGTKITTVDGYKNIEDIKIGDSVLTHTLSWRNVEKTFIHTHHKKILEINDRLSVTPNHEFYVVHKKYLGLLTDENIEKYAIWISAENLTRDFLMLEHKVY